MLQRIPCLLLLLIPSLLSIAQTPKKESRYRPHDFFSEPFNVAPGNEYRSAKGIPGHAYWQNSASYVIHATLNEKDTSINGSVKITYRNNSPDALDYLWLQLDQNIFAEGSKASYLFSDPSEHPDITGTPDGGFKIGAVTIVQGTQSYHAQPIINDTRMQLFLEKPMKPKGGIVSIEMKFSFRIPMDGAGRFGRQYTKNGVIYQVAQWYPRMCVYDDVKGWNTLPYLGQGEFYLDYGNFDYYITAPAAMVVWGSGDLQNPEEVLTTQQIQRLKQAATSDKTVMIINEKEAGKPGPRPATKGNLTWHFKISNSRDVAWAAGKGMVWDAARVNVPSGRKVLAMSCYPLESVGTDAWSRSTEFLKASMEFYSKNYYEYPWNVAVSSAGITGGMEYPGMIFDDYREKDARLWFLVAHEIGHDWYPMIVGSNERRYMWQDEGLNTFIDYLATDAFNQGEYINAPDLLKKGFFASRDYEQFMNYKDPLMTQSDAMDVAQHWQYYGKTAYGLELLRSHIVGKERFDVAFKKYTEAWAFKHPTPYDFFNCMNNVIGEDLNWFWKEWFFTTWKLDQAISNVTYVDNDPGKGCIVSIVNKDKMIMPVAIRIIEENGNEILKTLPVEIWQRSAALSFRFATKRKIKKVVIDPDHVFPDMDRSNNEWREGK